MRTMLIVTMETEAGNKAISDGSLPEIMEDFFAKHSPESVYFTASNGDRTMYAVLDMKDVSEIPSIAEPFFVKLKAKIELKPAMNPEELKRGLAALTQS
jgi:hypothetical protein